MTSIDFRVLQPEDSAFFPLIADWYFDEWKIPVNKTIERLQSITTDNSQFQVLMTVDDTPVSTGGIYTHVGLLDKAPRFNIYKNWLALIYTTVDERQKGYGALICQKIQSHAKISGLDTLYLYTDTAESLYKKLDWTELERVSISNRNIVVMKKELNSVH